jgi:DNA-binding response OmpR family regulator
MHKPTLLLVEDDPNLGQILQEYLQVKGFTTHLATDGKQGLESYQQIKPDLCLLDVMLPEKDGFTLAKEIRQTDSQTPIIFLTAKDMKEDTLHGLRLGADDYITKPFSLEELLLRIRAILKRVQGGLVQREQASNRYSIGQFTFLPDQHELRRGPEVVSLTGREAALLRLLAERKGEILSRTHALKTLWHDDNYFNARSMDVYITKLRKLLQPDPNIQILSVRGEGFRLVEVN